MFPENNPFPWTERFIAGEVVPIPKEPVGVNLNRSIPALPNTANGPCPWLVVEA